MKETPTSLHPYMQFLILTAVVIGCMLLGLLIGLVIVLPLYGMSAITHMATFDTTYPGVINTLWIFQIASTTVPLFAAPVVFGRFIVREPAAYLKPTVKIPPVLFLLVFAVMLFSTPAMAWLVELNQKMVFPHWLQGVYDWMKQHEDEAQHETGVLLQMKTLGSMLFVLLVVGLLTAIAEEFLFRGCIQTIFTRWTKSVHWGIWISAIIFSMIHMEFFGFVPRLLLGVFFGYFVAYSGSIWTGVWGHFINNGSQVVLTYLFQKKLSTIDPDASHFNYFIITLSVVTTVFLFRVYRNIAPSKKALPV